MTQVDRTSIHNRLLRALPAATLERLKPALSRLSLSRAQPIDRENQPIEHLYFVDRGLISLVKTMSDGRSIEVGTVGIEGLTAPNSLFGLSGALLDSLVQVPGEALRVQRELLKREMEDDEPLRRLIQNYARFSYGQLAQTAACNRLHSLEARCCRWLLIAHDSALSDTFPLTHEFLAMMLGVQRSGVSIAARILKHEKLIDYTRGRVVVLDRDGLERAACECYAYQQRELNALFSAKPHRPGAGRDRSFNL